MKYIILSLKVCCLAFFLIIILFLSLFSLSSSACSLLRCFFSSFAASTSEMGLSNNNICFSSLSALNIYYFFCSPVQLSFNERAMGCFPFSVLSCTIDDDGDDGVLCVFTDFSVPFYAHSAAKTFRICAVMFAIYACVCV